MFAFSHYENMIFSESLAIFMLVLIFALFFAFSRRKVLFVICSSLLIFLLYFYRNPVYCRVGPDAPANMPEKIYSPCFGTVLRIIRGDKLNCICVFLSPFDVHTQFMPAEGRIISKEYRPGQFNPAYMMEKTVYNECMRTTIATAHGDIVVDQVAGQLVRRIVNHTEVGKIYLAGALIGMIKFGSMVRVFLPKNINIAVKPGDKLAGPQTIISVVG